MFGGVRFGERSIVNVYASPTGNPLLMQKTLCVQAGR
jgi:hypothetical protein